MKPLRILLLVSALMATGCGGSGDGTGTSTTTPTSGPTTTTTTPSTTTVPVSTTTTSLPAGPQFVRVYFLVEDVDGDGGPFVRPVTRSIEPTPGVATAALGLLIEGPSAEERAGIPAVSGGLPDGTRLLGLTIADGTARVDLSREIENVGGTFGEMSVLAQVVFTLTQFPTVEDVELLIDGDPVEFFGGHGLQVGPSMDRDFFLGSGLVPEILIDQPAWLAETESPLLVTGIGRMFEATARWALYDNDGLPLSDGLTTAGAGGPDWGAFQFAVPYTVDSRQLGSLMMWEESAADGSRLHLVEHPIWLNP